MGSYVSNTNCVLQENHLQAQWSYNSLCFFLPRQYMFDSASNDKMAVTKFIRKYRTMTLSDFMTILGQIIQFFHPLLQ